MARSERRETVALVLLRVLRVTDADERRLEKAEDGREDLEAGQLRHPEVLVDARADLRERSREVEHPLVLRLVAHLTKALVIPILLAPLRVAARGLKVTTWIRRDPDVGPGGRYREPADAPELLPVGDRLAVGADVTEAATRSMPPDPPPLVARIAQPRVLRGRDDLRRRDRHASAQRRGRATLRPGVSTGHGRRTDRSRARPGLAPARARRGTRDPSGTGRQLRTRRPRRRSS